MAVAEASGAVRTRGVEARQAGDVLAVTVHLKLGPAARTEDGWPSRSTAGLLGRRPGAGVTTGTGPGRPLRICPPARTVYRGETEIVLIRRECGLLLCLAEHPRQVFTRWQRLDYVWR
jgi:hypothetical protein